MTTPNILTAAFLLASIYSIAQSELKSASVPLAANLGVMQDNLFMNEAITEKRIRRIAISKVGTNYNKMRTSPYRKSSMRSTIQANNGRQKRYRLNRYKRAKSR